MSAAAVPEIREPVDLPPRRQPGSPRGRAVAAASRAQQSTRRGFARILPPALMLLLGACASIPPPPQRNVANNVLFRAISLVGTPYHWGGNTPASGFDCSGLVDYVFRTEAGIALPRTSRAIAAVDAPRIPRNRLASGDLLFFGHHGRVNHVAIYVGRGRFVNAPDRGGTVRLDALDGFYWRNHYLFAKRVLSARTRAALAAN
jgi:NlpC/P60 family